MSWSFIEHEGRRHRVALVRTAGGVWVGYRGGAVFVKSQVHAARDAVAEHEVVAPMTGKVVQVRAKEGARVEADEVLVVLEAMKMEYRLVAPRAGVVARVSCKEGELVDLGATLVSFAD